MRTVIYDSLKERKELTLERAKELKGKTIIYNYPCNQSRMLKKITVGEIISEWDYFKTQPMEGWANRTEYWASFMTPKQIEDKKNLLLLLDADGKETYLFCESKVNWEEGPTFHCSDSDRLVSYREYDEDDAWEEQFGYVRIAEGKCSTSEAFAIGESAAIVMRLVGAENLPATFVDDVMENPRKYLCPWFDKVHDAKDADPRLAPVSNRFWDVFRDYKYYIPTFIKPADHIDYITGFKRCSEWLDKWYERFYK
jgi:hypothetical protein